MINYGNHLGTIRISKRYLIKQVTQLAEGCFGIAGLRKVEITSQANTVSVRLNVVTSDGVNLPAVSRAVSHKVSYVLTQKLGVSVRKIEIFTEDIVC